MEERRKSTHRVTNETDVHASVNIDGSGDISIDTGVIFIDHMISSFAKHAVMDLAIKAESRDHIIHHLIEDTAISMGRIIDEALGDRTGIVRFGHASVPLDEALAEASVDLIRRPYHTLSLDIRRTSIEDASKEDIEHFFQSLLNMMNCCIHLTVRYGDNDHHKIEAATKSLAVAFRNAASRDPRQTGIPSTKGMM